MNRQERAERLPLQNAPVVCVIIMSKQCQEGKENPAQLVRWQARWAGANTACCFLHSLVFGLVCIIINMFLAGLNQPWQLFPNQLLCGVCVGPKINGRNHLGSSRGRNKTNLFTFDHKVTSWSRGYAVFQDPVEMIKDRLVSLWLAGLPINLPEKLRTSGDNRGNICIVANMAWCLDVPCD